MPFRRCCQLQRQLQMRLASSQVAAQLASSLAPLDRPTLDKSPTAYAAPLAAQALPCLSFSFLHMPTTVVAVSTSHRMMGRRTTPPPHRKELVQQPRALPRREMSDVPRAREEYELELCGTLAGALPRLFPALSFRPSSARVLACVEPAVAVRSTSPLVYKKHEKRACRHA